MHKSANEKNNDTTKKKLLLTKKAIIKKMIEKVSPKLLFDGSLLFIYYRFYKITYF